MFSGALSPLEPATCYEFEQNSNLYLLPGHIDFSEYDATYNIAENLTGSLFMLKNIPGALRNLLQMTSEKYQFEYILIDMSPNISATNANILMESDYFILPCAPDYFCYMANYYDEEYNLINIADFNSLIAQSQAKNTPVFMLTQEQVQKNGNVWLNMKKNIDDFNETFNCLADRIVDATK